MGASEMNGRTAIVTGSGRNMGRAIAVALAQAGANIVVNARTSEAEARETAARVEQAGGKAVVKLADVTHPDDAAALIAAAVDAFGGLDVIVNNAAVRIDKPLAEMSFEDYHRVLSSTLDGPFLLAQAGLPHLRASDRAAIVNIGGVAAHAGIDDRVGVCTAKAGLNGMTRALAFELAEHDITVNTVSPGYIATDRKGGHIPKHFRERPVPLKRQGKPEEVAGMVRMLAGPEGRYITGQVIQVNGGWYMGG